MPHHLNKPIFTRCPVSIMLDLIQHPAFSKAGLSADLPAEVGQEPCAPDALSKPQGSRPTREDWILAFARMTFRCARVIFRSRGLEWPSLKTQPSQTREPWILACARMTFTKAGPRRGAQAKMDPHHQTANRPLAAYKLPQTFNRKLKLVAGTQKFVTHLGVDLLDGCVSRPHVGGHCFVVGKILTYFEKEGGFQPS